MGLFKNLSRAVVPGAQFYTKGFHGLTGKTGRDQAARDLAAGRDEARGLALSAFPQAKAELIDYAERGRKGFSDSVARSRLRSRSGFGDARRELTAGYDAAEAEYQTPEMLAASGEVAERVAGRGGFSDALLNSMKANAREEYGAAGRDIMQQTGRYRGDAYAPGQAAEGVGRGFAEIGRRRADAVRGIDLQDAALKEDQQTGAIAMTRDHAAVMASLKLKRREGLGSLTLAEAENDNALSEEERRYFASLEDMLGRSISGMTLDQAQTLAQIALGTSAQLAGTRDTKNYLPDLLAAGAKVGAAAYGAGGG